MRANPGGIVSPDDVVGRDEIIERLWKILEKQGLVIGAERRLGKTSIIKKMQAEPPDETIVIYMDVEGVSTATEFVEKLAQTLTAHLDASKKAGKWLNEMWSSFGGTEIAGILKLPKSKRTHWKNILERLFKDLSKNTKKLSILIWDELPWMLQKIDWNENSAVVVDLLDLLRGMRHTHSEKIRLVYTGSIGLHHVLSNLHEQGFIHEPNNDMRKVEIPPLKSDDAQNLATMLLLGEELPIAEEGVAKHLAELVENIPYYIHHVVADLSDIGLPVTLEAVDTILAKALTSALDQWDFEHYRTRLKEYYKDKADIAHGILDILAEFEPLSLNEIAEYLKTNFKPRSESARKIIDSDRNQLRSLVKLMQRDHYLRQDPQRGTYSFYFNLIRRWWRLDLGI